MRSILYLVLVVAAISSNGCCVNYARWVEQREKEINIACVVLVSCWFLYSVIIEDVNGKSSLVIQKERGVWTMWDESLQQTIQKFKYIVSVNQITIWMQ